MLKNTVKIIAGSSFQLISSIISRKFENEKKERKAQVQKMILFYTILFQLLF